MCFHHFPHCCNWRGLPIPKSGASANSATFALALKSSYVSLADFFASLEYQTVNTFPITCP
jgi:hypothetical protein